jgi:hypothetical protein
MAVEQHPQIQRFVDRVGRQIQFVANIDPTASPFLKESQEREAIIRQTELLSLVEEDISIQLWVIGIYTAYFGELEGSPSLDHLLSEEEKQAAFWVRQIFYKDTPLAEHEQGKIPVIPYIQLKDDTVQEAQLQDPIPDPAEVVEIVASDEKNLVPPEDIAAAPDVPDKRPPRNHRATGRKRGVPPDLALRAEFLGVVERYMENNPGTAFNANVVAGMWGKSPRQVRRYYDELIEQEVDLPPRGKKGGVQKGKIIDGEATRANFLAALRKQQKEPNYPGYADVLRAATDAGILPVSGYAVYHNLEKSHDDLPPIRPRGGQKKNKN